MIPTIDTNNYEEMWVSNYHGVDAINNEIKEKIHFMCNGRACSVVNDRNEIVRVRSWQHYRKVEKKYKPLSSTFQIPGWVFGFICVSDEWDCIYMEHIFDGNTVIADDKMFNKTRITLEDLCGHKYKCSREIDGQQYTFKFYVECEE